MPKYNYYFTYINRASGRAIEVADDDNPIEVESLLFALVRFEAEDLAEIAGLELCGLRVEEDGVVVDDEDDEEDEEDEEDDEEDDYDDSWLDDDE